MRAILLFIILMTGWILMSGHYNLLLISLGVISIIFIVWLGSQIDATDEEGLPTHLFARLPAYLFWLFGEILKANISTAKIILGKAADPELFEVAANQVTAAGLATYANSITLTPGTVTVDIDEAQSGASRFLIHALHPKFGDDVRSGDMNRRSCALEALSIPKIKALRTDGSQ